MFRYRSLRFYLFPVVGNIKQFTIQIYISICDIPVTHYLTRCFSFICLAPSGPDHVTITGLETPKRLGEHTSLTCVTSPSDPAASITWFARGRKLTDAVTSVDKTPDGYVTTSRLEIHVTDKDENATYKCRADNKELGKTVWSSVILRIYGMF